MKQHDDTIRNTDDLKKALEGLNIPVFEVAKLPARPEMSEQEKRRVQLEAIQRAKRFGRDGR